MNDERKDTSGKTATAEAEHRPDRSTTAGLGMFDRVNELVGTNRIGTAPGIGGATEQEISIGPDPGIAGLERTIATDTATGASGMETPSTRFTADEDRYWRETHSSRHYANPASNYEEYQPAYQYGTDAAHRYQGRKWADAEGDLERGWNDARGGSSLAWGNVKDAVRAAWHRVERALPGDADHDGR
jgi:hypothetical protein